MRHYLDHASTSPLRPAVRQAMIEFLETDVWADPGRIHHEGMMARAVLEQAREQVAEMFGTRSRSLVFTSSATESIASACAGVPNGHQVLSAVEHSAVRKSAQRFARQVSIVGCDSGGAVDPDELLAAVRPDTTLVHLQWANHEVGTLQPVREVVRRCRERGVLVHVDAATAAAAIPLAFDELGADLMSIAAHKMGGPPGIGALLIRRGLRIEPLLVGADQERARRAGLENIAGAVGWAAIAGENIADHAQLVAWHGQLVATARSIDDIEVFGPHAHHVPHIVCLGIGGVEPQAVLLGLDQRAIAVHSGSACASEDLLPSPVLEAMGVDAHRSLRVSTGWSTTDADIDAFAVALPDVVEYLRSLAR